MRCGSAHDRSDTCRRGDLNDLNDNEMANEFELVSGNSRKGSHVGGCVPHGLTDIFAERPFSSVAFRETPTITERVNYRSTVCASPNSA